MSIFLSIFFNRRLIAFLLIASNSVPGILSHNYVECTNAKPNLTALLTEPLVAYDSSHDHCDGYPRGMPDANSFQGSQSSITGQGFPWQFIWPMQENNALTTHRACNWNQELPVYDPSRNITSVKPGATIMVKVATNGHAHEYETGRAAGHHKVYLAGDPGTHITAANQLTDDRVIFMAPMTKYAHLVGTGAGVAQGTGDPGYAWLPLKLVDPSGKTLPAGAYNLVFTWWWPGGQNNKEDFMLPSYSTCFDINIDAAAEDGGYLTNYVNRDKNAHVTLIGNNTSPGAKDHTSPWPPFPDHYLNKNYDGDDPDQPSSQRTFQPYFSKHIDTVKMPQPKNQQIYPIQAWTDAQLTRSIVSPPGSSDNDFPENLTIVGNITMRGTDSLPITGKLTPITVGSGSGFGKTELYPVDDPYLNPSFVYSDTVHTPSAVPSIRP